MKTWYKITIPTSTDQTIELYPDELGGGIIVEVREADSNINKDGKLYLNEDEMEMLILKMKEMMRNINGW